jgi:hypothetical protein
MARGTKQYADLPRSIRGPYLIEAVKGRELSFDHGGWNWPPDVDPVPEVGDQLVIETVQYSEVVGAQVNGEWRFSRTNEELQAKFEEYLAQSRQRDIDRLEEMRGEYIGREENLPRWAQQRLKRFHDAGGLNFELIGWGYELTTVELAVILLSEQESLSGPFGPQAKAFDDKHGLSGNMVDFARAMARMLLDGREQDVIGAPAAFSPLTGSADYAGVEA